MRFLGRMAFYAGMATGVAAIAATGAVALTYLFTGKFVSVTTGEGKPAVTLMAPAEIVEMVRRQAAKGRAAAKEPAGEEEGHG